MNLSGTSKPLLPRSNSKGAALPPIHYKRHATSSSPVKKIKSTTKRVAKPCEAVVRNGRKTLLPKDIPNSVTLTHQAEAALAAPANPNETTGEVRLRFNHYNKAFHIHNSVLKWSDVDAEYCFSTCDEAPREQELKRRRSKLDTATSPPGESNPIKSIVREVILALWMRVAIQHCTMQRGEDISTVSRRL